MNTFDEFLETIENPKHRSRMEEMLDWITKKYPDLNQEIKWKQPMFTDHGTYIIGFSVSKKHIAVAPEQVAINQFLEDIKVIGYDHTKEIIRIPWSSEIDYSLLEKLIEFNIIDKSECTTFWR
ncbi:iron chaperone [Oceanobacillus sp. 1P07AA]|uniref:iron chaperone n=1 Tax=Oceanobacillus sp. 1P07AA TaxID=3132293 RepID=UPI0039A53D8D